MLKSALLLGWRIEAFDWKSESLITTQIEFCRVYGIYADKALVRLRMKSFESLRTDYFTLSTYSFVLDDLGRPDFELSIIKPVS